MDWHCVYDQHRLYDRGVPFQKRYGLDSIADFPRSSNTARAAQPAWYSRSVSIKAESSVVMLPMKQEEQMQRNRRLQLKTKTAACCHWCSGKLFQRSREFKLSFLNTLDQPFAFQKTVPMYAKLHVDSVHGGRVDARLFCSEYSPKGFALKYPKPICGTWNEQWNDSPRLR